MSQNDKAPDSATGVVTVGCKLPNGLHLDLKANDGAIVRHTLKGANAARIVGGYGITENIPDDFMKAWLKKNAKHPAVISGAVFIHNDTKSAETIAKERSGAVTTGLEPVDPLKNGMLKGADGELDKSAVALYNEQRNKNPSRNSQRVE